MPVASAHQFFDLLLDNFHVESYNVVGHALLSPFRMLCTQFHSARDRKPCPLFCYVQFARLIPGSVNMPKQRAFSTLHDRVPMAFQMKSHRLCKTIGRRIVPKALGRCQQNVGFSANPLPLPRTYSKEKATISQRCILRDYLHGFHRSFWKFRYNDLKRKTCAERTMHV